MVKFVLIVVFLQAAATEEPLLAVMSSLSAEYDNQQACLGAMAVLDTMGKKAGYVVQMACTPKNVAKLDVVPKKEPKSKDMAI